MITVVGSLNMDLCVETEHLPAPGETVTGHNFRRSPGGKGANQAVAIARLRHPCALIGMLGADSFGDELLSNLQANGVDVTGVARSGHVSTGSALVVIDAHGRNQIVVSGGANALLAPGHLASREDLFRKSQAVIVQLETSLDVAMESLKRARANGALAVLNPAPWTHGAEALLAECDWLIPNETEASALIQSPIDSVQQAGQAARSISAQFHVPNVAITLGEKGAWLHTSSFTGPIAPQPVSAVDTVGAGDAFCGAFVFQLVEGAQPREAAHFACAAAALAVTRRGAQSAMPARIEVYAFLRNRIAN